MTRTPAGLLALPCRFGCREPAVALVHYPEGCICWPDHVQALCAQHVEKGLQNNEGKLVQQLRAMPEARR